MGKKSIKQNSINKKGASIKSESLDAARKSISDTKLMWILGSIAFLLYSQTINYGFVLDDITVIENNTIVQKGFSGIPELFTTFYWEGYWNLNAGLYRPLSMVAFAIEWSISPNNPTIHHFMNVFYYALTIGLLYKLLRKIFAQLSPWISFSIVLIFLSHPTHTEVVANIKSRDEIFCLLFFILSFLVLLREDLKPIRQIGMASLLFLLCLLSKEGGIMFLPVLGAYFLWIKGFTMVKTLKKIVPLILVGIMWLILHQSVIHNSPSEPISYTFEDNSLVASANGMEQLASGFAIFGKYVVNSFVPRKLSYDYSYGEIPLQSFTSPYALVGIFLFIAILVLVVLLLKRKKEIAFGLIWFLTTILLVTNIITLIGTTFADRLLYSPSLGISIVLVLVIYQLVRNKSVLPVWNISFMIVITIGGLYSFQTVSRNKAWQSNEVLFTTDVKNSTKSARVHYNYGVVLLNQKGDTLTSSTKSIEQFQIATRINPKDQGSYSNMAVAYFRIGEYKKSIDASLAALKLKENDTITMGNLADVYVKLKEFENAIKYYEVYAKSKEAKPGTFERYGYCYVQQKEYDKAIDVFKMGINRFPNFDNLYMNLGNVYGMKNEIDSAIAVFKKAYEMNPANRNALRMMLTGYEMIGDSTNFQKYIGPYNQMAQ